MAYVNEDCCNGNGKKNGGSVKSLLGEVALEYGGARLNAVSPLLAAVSRVMRSRVPKEDTTPHRENLGLAPIVEMRKRLLAARTLYPTTTLPKPSINIVTLPNGTAVPAAILPPPAPNPLTDLHVGGTNMNPYTYSGNVDPGPAGTQGGSSGSSFGPPNYPPVEVNTLPTGGGGDSTGGPALAGLSGLTSNPLVLGLIALAAFKMLDGKPKRRRR